MIICLLLDSNNIRRHLSSSEILLFDKGCCPYTSTVVKDKYEKGDVRFGQKKPAFPFHFSVYEVEGSEFCMSVYHHLRQLVVQEFFPNKV